MKNLILITLFALGISFGAQAQQLVTCAIDTTTYFQGFINNGSTFNIAQGGSNTTAVVYATAGSATTYATLTVKITKVSGTTVVTATPVVSNDGVTWSNLFTGINPNAQDSVTYTFAVASTMSRSRSYPLGYKYIGQKITATGSSAIVTVSGKAYIK